jgi:predicted nucleotidyltransferase
MLFVHVSVSYILAPLREDGSRGFSFARWRAHAINEIKSKPLVESKTMTTFDELNHTLQAHLDELRRDFAVSEIGIFGSFVRGEQREGSDVDMLVDFTRPVGFITFLKLENRLREILGKEVDLVTRKALKPHIGRRILNEVRYVH